MCKPPINTVDTVHTVELIENSPAGIRVVSNAGGVNPLACASAIQEAAKKAGVDLKVSVVTGDDLMPNVRFSLCEAVITVSVHEGCTSVSDFTLFLSSQRQSLTEVKIADDGSTRQLPSSLYSMNAYVGYEHTL